MRIILYKPKEGDELTYADNPPRKFYEDFRKVILKNVPLEATVVYGWMPTPVRSSTPSFSTIVQCEYFIDNELNYYDARVYGWSSMNHSGRYETAFYE